MDANARQTRLVPPLLPLVIQRQGPVPRLVQAHLGPILLPGQAVEQGAHGTGAPAHWAEVPGHYDDGGLSGGTLERPALQRLLAEVAAGAIDIIVVYKVDRLTRSLLDFSKLVEAFDASGTSFVSVTQSFNTTTRMGRLTLNMLLSFAQFEREVTAERIRDKIAASKAKGMWMGGIAPLGCRIGRSWKRSFVYVRFGGAAPHLRAAFRRMRGNALSVP
ncbi:recombinase family protein [Sphingomonas sp. PB2P19]|uniref:recombinase family protein n=1 Tax=Sphingomonas rhamnosi TaxID=3096156 RepID=UPI002FC70062